jgi:capsid portal protein
VTDQDYDIQPEIIEKDHDVLVAGFTLHGTSKQLDDDIDQFTPDDAITPPLDLDTLAALSKLNATRKSCIEAITRNTVGLGYELVVAPGHEEHVDKPSEVGRTLRATLEALARRDQRLDSPSFTKLLQAVKTDEEEVGNGYIEVSRNKLDGSIDGLFHAPGKRIRRLKDRNGYVMLDKSGFAGAGNERVDFYNYGDKASYDESGNPVGIRDDRDASHNEIISFRLYTSESRDYGLPRDIGLALEYAGDKLAAEFNISFFDSGGTPPTIIFVTGEAQTQGSTVRLTVPQQTVQRIAETLRSDGARQNRVAIIPLPPGAQAQSHTLGTVSDRDMGFVNFRKDNFRRTLMAFRLGPIFLASADEQGRYDAEVQRALGLEQVFDPEQVEWEDRLNHGLLREINPDMSIKFKRLAVEGDAVKRESAMDMAQAKAITLREFRGAFGYSPLPEAPENTDPEPGQYPFGINDRLVDISKPGTQGGDQRRQPERARPEQAQDQRGLRPGLGGRQQQSTDEELQAARVANGAPKL